MYSLSRCWWGACFGCLLATAAPAPGQLSLGQPPEFQREYGLADLHNHQFASYGFSGQGILGAPFNAAYRMLAAAYPGDWPELNHAFALHCCGQPDAEDGCASECLPAGWLHGLCGAASIMERAAGLGGTHEVSGWPEFKGWPHWKSITHQQVYYSWLQRAWEGGLRLMVMLAVDNEVFCDLIECDVPGDSPYSCDQMNSVHRQVNAARELEDFIDWLDDGDDGNDTGWYRIVDSPQEAREIIRQGKLAVVLGVEMSSLLDCLGGRCNEEDLDRLDDLWLTGVRHVFPIHEFDNDFGGAAAFDDMVNAANKVAHQWASGSGDFLEVEDCFSPDPAQGYQFKFREDELLGKVKQWLTCAPEFSTDYPDEYEGKHGHCNARGLSALGSVLIERLIEKKMIIDVDHMSLKTRTEVYRIAQKHCYPLVASHMGFAALSRNDKSYEQSRYLLQDIDKLRDLGGLIGPIMATGNSCEFGESTVGTVVDPEGCIEEYYNSGVANDCSNSSKTWAQVYRYAVDQMNGAPVGLGSDFHAPVHQPSPRYGPDACNEQPVIQPLEEWVYYPYEPFISTTCSSSADCGEFQTCEGGVCKMSQLTFGEKSFDINIHGMAHVGMLPDFIEDLRKVGLARSDLLPLFYSADAYIHMWERIEGVAELVYVNDDANVTCGGGIPENPYASIGKALEAVAWGGDVVIRPGSYDESLFIEKEVTLWASGGDVMIGR